MHVSVLLSNGKQSITSLSLFVSMTVSVSLLIPNLPGSDSGMHVAPLFWGGGGGGGGG